MWFPQTSREAHCFCHLLIKVQSSPAQNCQSGPQPLLRYVCGARGQKAASPGSWGGRVPSSEARGKQGADEPKRGLILHPSSICGETMRLWSTWAHAGHTSEEPVTSLVPGAAGKRRLLVFTRTEEGGRGPGPVWGSPAWDWPCPPLVGLRLTAALIQPFAWWPQFSLETQLALDSPAPSGGPTLSPGVSPEAICEVWETSRDLHRAEAQDMTTHRFVWIQVYNF